MSNKFNRFDFEQQIMNCWNVTTDLRDLQEGVLESNMTKDQITNVLMGLEQLYQLRFDKLFCMFDQGVCEQAFQSTKTEDEVQDPKSLLREFVAKFDHEHFFNQTSDRESKNNPFDATDKINAETADAQKKYVIKPYIVSQEAMDEITMATLREYHEVLMRQRDLVFAKTGEEFNYNIIAALDLVLSKISVR
jgi:hypothetical protein